MIPIDWGDLEQAHRIQDGDVIVVSYADIDQATTEFVLEKAPHKRWWKGLQLLDNTDGEMGFLNIKDGSHSDGPISVPSANIETGGHVVLWKAKLFGVHTPMYVLTGLEHVKGKKVTFTWVAD